MRPLSISDIEPYMKGDNVIQYTNSGNEEYLGEIKEIRPDCWRWRKTLKSITITTSWLVRVQLMEHLDKPETLEMIEGSFVPDERTIRFESPIVSQVRSPLIFTSGTEKVQMSHKTPLISLVDRFKKELKL